MERSVDKFRKKNWCFEIKYFIFFIIEIQISTKALRLHLSDMDIQFKE